MKREQDMYPMVKRWFQESRQCLLVTADLATDKLKVKVDRNTRRREIDVTALELTEDGLRVHLAEGKWWTSGSDFDVCLAQMESVRAYCDSPWVFFPREQWNDVAPGERRLNQDKVNACGFGLLLVGPEGCDEILKPRTNTARDEAKVNLVLDQLGHGQDATVPTGPALSLESRSAAALAMAVTTIAQRAVETAGKKVGTKRLRWDYLADGESARKEWFSSGADLENGASVELDPFGLYLRDGVPVVWFFQGLPIEKVSQKLDRVQEFGTHIYGDSGSWQWRIEPLQQVTPEFLANLKSDGFDSGGANEVHVAHRIEVMGKRVDELSNEVSRVWRGMRGWPR